MAYHTEKKFLVRVVALAIVAGLIVGSAITFAVMQWTQRIRNVATLKVLGVGVYKDINFTISVTEIDWGVLEAGETKNFNAYIKNESNVPISLAMSTENWEPINASSFINLAWNYSEELIPIEGSIPVTFILNVDSEISGIRGFSFTLVIIGSG